MNSSRLATGLLCAIAAAVPVMASEEGASLGTKLITPHFGTVVWTLITFLIMAWLLAKYAWKPLLGALDAREQSIKESIDQADRNREQSEQALTEHRELLNEARRERSSALEQGRQDAEKLKAEIVEAAQGQREQLLKQTQEQVQAELRQAKAELRGETVELAIKAAEKLLVKNLDDPTQRKLVEDYLTSLENFEGPGNLPS